jgi:hypothetical protein
MKATLSLNNKEYKVDIDKLIQLGVIQTESELKAKIESVEVGDVFLSENGVSILILETCNNFVENNCYQIAGLDGLKPYSDFPNPVDMQTILSFLNDGDYRFIRNINGIVSTLLNE